MLILLSLSPLGHAISVIDPSPSFESDDPAEIQCQDCLVSPLNFKFEHRVIADPKYLLNMGDWRLYDYPFPAHSVPLEETPPVVKPLVPAVTKSYITASIFVVLSGLIVFIIMMVKRLNTFRPIFSSI